MAPQCVTPIIGEGGIVINVFAGYWVVVNLQRVISTLHQMAYHCILQYSLVRGSFYSKIIIENLHPGRLRTTCRLQIIEKAAYAE